MMYADDLLLFKPISCQQDLSTFQCDVNLISQWTLQNHLCLNCNKTKYMLISRSRPGSCSYFNSPIYVYNNQIERVHQYKYLGVWISDDLTWSKHIESVCSRSRRLLGYIFRTFSPHCSPDSILHIYKTQVLPILNYACIVWDPHHKKDQLYFLRKSNCLLLELQQNASGSDFSPYQPQPPITDEPPLISETYFCF